MKKISIYRLQINVFNHKLNLGVWRAEGVGPTSIIILSLDLEITLSSSYSKVRVFQTINFFYLLSIII